MSKIQLASRILSVCFKFFCWFIPLITIYLILFKLPKLLDMSTFVLMMPAVHIDKAMQFSLLHRLIILTIQFLPLSITIMICYKLAKLFRLYAEGKLFEQINIKLIKSISVYMIVGQVIQLIYQPLITAALTFTNPPGQRIASITLGSANVSTLITAMVILVASWIVKEANQLKLDAQLTI
ncbi:Protein of uncharacterised function (DUF2975) [Legionella busanensis]|uniref:Protein of uncharacterized function (DUF2975) n=1 Tax=Legionella busanensis TaxID=190655 RepID=A0A378JTT7_9GAMM|nr:DUF2975 domain-containing protein [Legionella busanensis]STX51602.1 Protein of uncharacterised function (DUF2975) [Legionella busanensis]